MQEILFAVALLMPTKDSHVAGTLTLTQDSGYIVVAGEVTGLTPGKHGFHVHAFGDLRSADGSPRLAATSIRRTIRTAGRTTKNITPAIWGTSKPAHDGVAKVNAKVKGLTVRPLIGRSLVVHAKADDLKTQPAGDSGPRIAVGDIGLAETPEKK